MRLCEVSHLVYGHVVQRTGKEEASCVLGDGGVYDGHGDGTVAGDETPPSFVADEGVAVVEGAHIVEGAVEEHLSEGVYESATSVGELHGGASVAEAGSLQVDGRYDLDAIEVAVADMRMAEHCNAAF